MMTYDVIISVRTRCPLTDVMSPCTRCAAAESVNCPHRLKWICARYHPAVY